MSGSSVGFKACKPSIIITEDLSSCSLCPSHTRFCNLKSKVGSSTSSPLKSAAKCCLNSSTLYELAVLKKHIFPLLTAVGPEEECYNEVRAIVKFLDFIQEADVDDEIPPTSLVREFIGGNSFYK